jgi:alpha-tubulin suppressor-like RCC1 family protein
LLLTTNNNIFSFGDNSFGQLGLNSLTPIFYIPTQITLTLNNLDSILKISCGFYHSIILTKNGDVFSFGMNIVKIILIVSTGSLA